jgi:hypothetical protein
MPSIPTIVVRSEARLQALRRMLQPAAGALVMAGVSIGLGVAIAVVLGAALRGWPS